MTAFVTIEPKEAKRIGAIAALLGSDRDGEKLAAANMLSKALAKHDLRIGEVVERGLAPVQLPPPISPHRPDSCADHGARASACLESPYLYSPKELRFLRDVRGFRRPSLKQLDWLNALYARWTEHEEDF